jgi:hypothetical protein
MRAAHPYALMAGLLRRAIRDPHLVFDKGGPMFGAELSAFAFGALGRSMLRPVRRAVRHGQLRFQERVALASLCNSGSSFRALRRCLGKIRRAIRKRDLLSEPFGAASRVCYRSRKNRGEQRCTESGGFDGFPSSHDSLLDGLRPGTHTARAAGNPGVLADTLGRSRCPSGDGRHTILVKYSHLRRRYRTFL